MVRHFQSLPSLFLNQFHVSELLETDASSATLIDFGNALMCVQDELSLYYKDFEIQTLLYRAPEVSTCCANVMLSSVQQFNGLVVCNL